MTRLRSAYSSIRFTGARQLAPPVVQRTSSCNQPPSTTLSPRVHILCKCELDLCSRAACVCCHVDTWHITCTMHTCNMQIYLFFFPFLRSKVVIIDIEYVCIVHPLKREILFAESLCAASTVLFFVV